MNSKKRLYGVTFKLFSISIFLGFVSCAPVDFNKETTLAVSPICTESTCDSQTLKCDPKIKAQVDDGGSDTLSDITVDKTVYTYTSFGTSSKSSWPSIAANCANSPVDVNWIVQKADGAVVENSIPGLVGENPSEIDFTVLGPGAYYVFLEASKLGSGFNSYKSSIPLEFVVPGGEIGSGLTCDPKLSFNNVVMLSSSVVMGDTKTEAAFISANCLPLAENYLWRVTKDEKPFVISGLNGPSSVVDFSIYGAGTYKIFLYAILTNSTHWQSSTPLVLEVHESNEFQNKIECNPRLNGSLAYLTLDSISSSPLISGNCLPANVQYTWSVFKKGQLVTDLNLSGANSNPDFSSMGAGTYLIYLTASSLNPSLNPNSNSNISEDLASWSTTNPLVVRVDSKNTQTPIQTPTLSCAPRLNETSVATTISLKDKNPRLSSGCNVETALHNWQVYKNGSPIQINGLNGLNSSGDFIGSGPGIYFIYLTASAMGYHSYAGVSPLEVRVVAEAESFDQKRDEERADSKREVIFEKPVRLTDYKVDILFVMDVSKSMASVYPKLIHQLEKFESELTSSGLDWQMCFTVTRPQSINKNGTYYWGASRNWLGYRSPTSWILKNDVTNSSVVFSKSINAILNNLKSYPQAEEEHGLKAAWWNIAYKSYNNCYRDNAVLVVILITDGDERSDLKTRDADDQPQELINKIKQEFGMNKRFTFNSIIVKPEDANSLIENFREIKDQIKRLQKTYPLECAPVGNIQLKIKPAISRTPAFELQNNNLILNSDLPEGRTVHVSYNCPGR